MHKLLILALISFIFSSCSSGHKAIDNYEVYSKLVNLLYDKIPSSYVKEKKIDINASTKPFEGRTNIADNMIYERDINSADIKETIDLNKIKLSPENLLKINQSNQNAKMKFYYEFFKIYISSELNHAYCIVGRYEVENKPKTSLWGS